MLFKDNNFLQWNVWMIEFEIVSVLAEKYLDLFF